MKAILAILATVPLMGCINYEALQRASDSQVEMAEACYLERAAMWEAINGENVAAQNEAMMVMGATLASVMSPCGAGQTNAMDVMVAFGKIHRDLALGMVPLANTYFQWRGLADIVDNATGDSSSVQNKIAVSDEASYTGDFASNVDGNQATGGSSQNFDAALGGSQKDTNDSQLGNEIDQRGGDGETAGSAGSTSFSPTKVQSDTDVF